MYFSLTSTLKKNLHHILLLVFITCVAYLPSLNNQFVWDDEQFIYNNAYVKNFSVTEIFTKSTTAGAGEESTYYRPLTTLSFAFDYQIWGLQPFGFHLTNTLLHLSAGLLLFFYLRTIKFSKVSAISITSIFLVHPLQTEAVVYANSRGDSLYVFFTMISLLSFALLLTKKYPSITMYDLTLKLNKRIVCITTPLFYLLAILGKEIGIATLGLIFLTYGFFNFKEIITRKKTFLKNNISETIVLITTFFTALLYLLFRNFVIQITTTQQNYFIGTSYGENVFVRLHTFTKALWTYFQLILAPFPLHMERTLDIIEQPVSVWLVATILFSIVILILAVQEYKKQKSGLILFGAFWFLSMLVPVSGIIPINGLIYEHWLYMPLIGFCIMVYGIKQTLVVTKYQEKVSIVLQNILVILIFVYIILTIRQNYLWANPIRFYSYTLQFNETARLRNNLAMAYSETKEYEQAIENYTRAIEINDSYPQTHYNLANSLKDMGATDAAKKEYSTAIRMSPSFLPAYVQLIQIFIAEKDYINAKSILLELFIAEPNLPTQTKQVLEKAVEQVQKK